MDWKCDTCKLIYWKCPTCIVLDWIGNVLHVKTFIYPEFLYFAYYIFEMKECKYSYNAMNNADYFLDYSYYFTIDKRLLIHCSRQLLTNKNDK